MKKMFLSSILTLGLGILMANEPVPSVKFISLEGKQVGFLVKFDSASNLQVRFIDEEGNILLRDLDTTESYMKRLNLENLEEGKYQIEVESDSRVFRYPVRVSREEVIIRETEYSLLVKPEITKNNKSVRVRIENIDFPVRIQLYDSKGHELYQNDYEESNQINTRFDLSNLERGKYRLRIQYSKLVFEESILVKN